MVMFVVTTGTKKEVRKFLFHEMRKIVMKKPSIKNIIIILLIVLALFGIYCFAHFAYVASAM